MNFNHLPTAKNFRLVNCRMEVMLMRKLCTINEVLFAHFPPTKTIRLWSIIDRLSEESSTNDFYGGNKYFPNMVLIFTLMLSICCVVIFKQKRIRLDESCQDLQLSSKYILIRSRKFLSILWVVKIYGKMCFMSFSVLHLLAVLKTCPMSCTP